MSLCSVDLMSDVRLWSVRQWRHTHRMTWRVCARMVGPVGPVGLVGPVGPVVHPLDPSGPLRLLSPCPSGRSSLWPVGRIEPVVPVRPVGSVGLPSRSEPWSGCQQGEGQRSRGLVLHDLMLLGTVDITALGNIHFGSDYSNDYHDNRIDLLDFTESHHHHHDCLHDCHHHHCKEIRQAVYLDWGCWK